MKKLLLLILLSPAFATMSLLGQVATATVNEITAAPGTQVVVPVEVENFNNVAAITLFFTYDPAVVGFDGFQNPAMEGILVSGTNYMDGTYRVGISWAPGSSTSITGTLVEVLFLYQGGTCDFIWVQSECDVMTLPYYESLPIIYTNGSIGPVGEAAVDIEDQNMAVPGNLAIPLNVNFSGVVEGVSSFTFVILYDENILTFQNISDFSTGFDNMQIYQFSSPTRLVLGWENPDLYAVEGSYLDGTLLNMNFSYSGGNTTLEFNEGACAMANNEVVEVSVIYSSGIITQDPASMINITLPDLTAEPGTQVPFPLAITNFSDIASFDLRINFDPAIVSFAELNNFISPLNATQFEINESAGELGISWIGGPVTFTEANLFDIIFNYSSGSSALVFDLEFCDVANNNVVSQIVLYNDGSISEDIVYEATATIPNLLATIGQTVDVPVYVTGFENLGAINFDIEFDAGVLNFVEGLSLHSGLSSTGTYNFNVSGTQIFFEWVLDPLLEQGPNIPDNDALFLMRFNFNGGTSPMAFNVIDCDVSRADDNITPILVTYTDGSVFGGIVSLAESTITANPTELEVGETSIITVQLKDQLGNNLPASGGVVELFTTLGNLSTVTDQNDGTYTATLSSAGSGTATISGTLNGDHFVDNAEVRFYYILTLEVVSGGTGGDEGKVKIGTEEFGPGSHEISISTEDVLLEAINGVKWKIYSWQENSVLQSPLGATFHNVTMDADKTVKATFHLPGDANCDGIVSAADIINIVNRIKILDPSPFCFENADVNKDNSISAADILLIVNIIKNQ